MDRTGGRGCCPSGAATTLVPRPHVPEAIPTQRPHKRVPRQARPCEMWGPFPWQCQLKDSLCPALFPPFLSCTAVRLAHSSRRSPPSASSQVFPAIEQSCARCLLLSASTLLCLDSCSPCSGRSNATPDSGSRPRCVTWNSSLLKELKLHSLELTHNDTKSNSQAPTRRKLPKTLD